MAGTFSNTDTGRASATFRSPTGASGIFHAFGYYDAPATEKALTNAAATQTYGTANGAYGAHAFLVAKETPAAPSGGATGTAKITVSGTSISTAGVRQTSDSEILCADVTTLTANKYLETAKMWIGTVTYTIAATGDHTTFAATINYGFASAYHFTERKVYLNQIECTGRAGAGDTGFNIQLLKHDTDSANWVFSAAAFVPGGAGADILAALATDYSTESALISGKRFHWHRKGMTTLIDGSTHEGVVMRITTGANNAVESSDLRLHFTYGD